MNDLIRGHDSTNRRDKLQVLDFLPVAAAGGAALLLLILVLILSDIYPLPGIASVTVPMAAGSVAMVALLRPRWIFYGYIALCMLIPNELDEMSVFINFMKVYPQDVLFLFLFLVTLLRAIAGKGSLHDIPFNRTMVLYLSLGVWAVLVGLLITGNPYDSVFGDFRRSFFYFLVYFFALLLTDNPEEIKLLKYALLGGAIAVIGRGLLQAVTGEFVTRRFSDAAHIMNHFEVTFSTFAVFLGLANLTEPGRRRWIWIILVLAGGLVVVLGNFRTCWLGFLGGLLVMAALLPRRQRVKLMWTAALFFLGAAMVLLLLWNVPVTATQSTIGENIAQKANWKAASTDTNVMWRIDSYTNAINLWQTQPIIGRGLGEKLEFYTSTSTGGSMLAIGHRVHNSYLWLLMSLGIVGFAVFTYVQSRFVFLVVQALRRDHFSEEARVTVTACLSFYATIMVSALFDVYLESSPPITILSVTMALCVLNIRYNSIIRKSDYAVPA